MVGRTSTSRRSRMVWTYGFGGGLASVAMLAVAYWLGVADGLTGNTVLLGGVLAGSLARRAGIRASSAGVRAGVIGGVPILLREVARLVGFPTDIIVWSNPLAEVGFVGLVGVALFGLAVLAGAIGGVIGGWLVGRLDARRTRTLGS